jgi:hypothetical protein
VRDAEAIGRWSEVERSAATQSKVLPDGDDIKSFARRSWRGSLLRACGYGAYGYRKQKREQGGAVQGGIAHGKSFLQKM